MDKVPNQLRKRIALIVTEKLNAYCRTNKGKKHNFSSTYIPFYDRHITYSPSACADLCLLLPPTLVTSEKPGVEKVGPTKFADRALKLSDKTGSDILTEEMLAQLGSKISPLLRMRPWDVIYKINSDGVSLRTFYSKVHKYNPTILIVQDHNKNVFGAFVSEQWQPCGRFYGTGESFLFTFKVWISFRKKEV